MIDKFIKNIQNLSEKLGSLKPTIDVIGIMPEFYDDIVELNTEDQLFDKGITSTGEHVPYNSPGQPYSLGYEQYKQTKGDPYDRVTLKDEGNFYAGFYVDRIGSGWDIDSTDEKTEELKSSYGSDIFGLTIENKEELSIELVLPSLITDYQNKINEAIENI